MTFFRLKTGSKYRNQRVQIDGISFCSKKEASRYQELKLLLAASQIKELILQPRFKLHSHQTYICTYVADFCYKENDKVIVEDVKGFKTDVFNIKWKMVKAEYGGSYDFRLWGEKAVKKKIRSRGARRTK